jgi:hypothetical protein
MKILNFLILQLCLLAYISIKTLVIASCPNHCNGKGECDKYSKCHCVDGFTGGDCSLRLCPVGYAWDDQPTETDVAHAKMECSHRGECERDSGVCICMAGFTGSACERLDCENHCNLQGTCYSMYDRSWRLRNSLSIQYSYDEIWDAKKIHGCICDVGFAGHDCSERLCVGGDDPLTTGQVNEIQLIKCIAVSGTFVLYFDGYPSKTIEYSASASDLETALLEIPILYGVKITFSDSDGTVCQASTNIISVEFTENFGPQAPMVAVTSSEMIDAGGSVTISGDGLTSFTDSLGSSYLSIKGTKENDQCSNRGLCITVEGTCECFNTNGDSYDSSNGYGVVGSRGDCGYILSGSSVSTCPGEIQCNGHGVCRSDLETFRCDCATGWGGGDCSEKLCPVGLSWFDYPSGNNKAHFTLSTCSDMGLCDKAEGVCACRSGFYGSACENMACGGGIVEACGLHGRCLSMNEMALWSEDNGDETDITFGDDPNNPITWEGKRIHGCLCDEGWHGYDCLLKTCPYGDDPGTYDDHVEVQLVQCVASGGQFKLSFRQAITEYISANATYLEVEAALNALPTILNAKVTFILDGNIPKDTLNTSKPDGDPSWGSFNSTTGLFEWTNREIAFTPTNACLNDGSQIMIIDFDAVHGDLPAIIVDDTSKLTAEIGTTPAISIFQDGQTVSGLVSIQGSTEVAECNNRGLCDYELGICNCFPTWSSSDGKGESGSSGDCGYRILDKNKIPSNALGYIP